jgi:hypothetical protein
VNELSNIKNKDIKKTYIKKTYIRKLGIRKLGVWGIIFLLCITCFLSGRISVAQADGSSAVLPISRGGTGSNTATEARANLNAQEQLISGTNIKTLFGNSVLGSGNITNQVSGNTLKLGEVRSFSFGFATPSYTINDILTFDLSKRAIIFKIGAWQSAYFQLTNYNNETLLRRIGYESISEPVEVQFQMDGYMSYGTGYIATTNGNYYVLAKCDNYSGFSARVERI